MKGEGGGVVNGMLAHAQPEEGFQSLYLQQLLEDMSVHCTLLK